MKKHLLLSAILGGVLALSIAPMANAATTASQTVNATLAALKSIVGKGTGLSGTIDPDTGIVTALAPSFTMTTNTNSALTLQLSATAPSTTTPQQALTNYAGHLGTYIVLANTTVPAVAAAITDITGGVLTSNANAIAFPFTPQATVAGQLTLGAWNAGGSYWPYTLTHKGNTDANNAIAGTALASSYDTNDEPGTYQATITMAFIP